MSVGNSVNALVALSRNMGKLLSLPENPIFNVTSVTLLQHFFMVFSAKSSVRINNLIFFLSIINMQVLYPVTRFLDRAAKPM